MKKFAIIVLLAIAAMGQAAAENKAFTVEGNVYSVSADTDKPETTDTVTEYFYKHGDTQYPIHLSRNGRAFIVLKSQKTGKDYRKYLGEEISRDLCKKCGAEYKEKPTRK